MLQNQVRSAGPCKAATKPYWHWLWKRWLGCGWCCVCKWVWRQRRGWARAVFAGQWVFHPDHDKDGRPHRSYDVLLQHMFKRTLYVLYAKQVLCSNRFPCLSLDGKCKDVSGLVRKYLPPGTYFETYQFYCGWCAAHIASQLGQILLVILVWHIYVFVCRWTTLIANSLLDLWQVWRLDEGVELQVDISHEIQEQKRIFTVRCLPGIETPVSW